MNNARNLAQKAKDKFHSQYIGEFNPEDELGLRKFADDANQVYEKVLEMSIACEIFILGRRERALARNSAPTLD